MMYLLFFLSLLFQIIFNISVSHISLGNVNILFLLISMVSLALFFLFLEKVNYKKLFFIFILVQIVFSLFYNIYLLLFAIPMILALFKDVKSSINISKLIFFVIFLLLPFIYSPLQEKLTETTITIFEPKIKKIIIDQIRINLQIDKEYTINASLFGFDFVVNNLKIENITEVKNLREIMVKQIENQTKYLEEYYIEMYAENIFLNLKNMIKEHKLYISIVVLLSIYYLLSIYLIFVTLLYEIFKKIIIKHL